MEPASSSTYPASDSLMSGLVEASFAVLRAEAAPSLGRVCELLAGISIGAKVDGERFGIVFTRAHASCVAEPLVPKARLITDRAAILEVIDGHASLAGAVWSGRIEIVADVDTLARLFDGLAAYVLGVVRARSSGALLGNLRQQARLVSSREEMRRQTMEE